MQAEVKDLSQRFVFDNTDTRGDVVQLDRALTDILALHDYPAAVNKLMGEFLAAATLLAGTLKFSGTLTLQMRSEGQIPLMMAQCSADLGLRAIARGTATATASDFDTLFSNGQLVITIDPDQGRRYQGIVAAGTSLSATLNTYFKQSEQLPTRLWLASDGKHCGGLLLQQLPPDRSLDSREREEQWREVCTLSDTLSADEIHSLQPVVLLHRLFHEHDLRLFEPRRARFTCSCSRERTLNALTALPSQEIQELLNERGKIDMDCEFCQQQYSFVQTDLEHLLNSNATTTRH